MSGDRQKGDAAAFDSATLAWLSIELVLERAFLNARAYSADMQTHSYSVSDLGAVKPASDDVQKQDMAYQTW